MYLEQDRLPSALPQTFSRNCGPQPRSFWLKIVQEAPWMLWIWLDPIFFWHLWYSCWFFWVPSWGWNRICFWYSYHLYPAFWLKWQPTYFLTNFIRTIFFMQLKQQFLFLISPLLSSRSHFYLKILNRAYEFSINNSTDSKQTKKHNYPLTGIKKFYLWFYYIPQIMKSRVSAIKEKQLKNKVEAINSMP